MLELFARPNRKVNLSFEGNLTPLHLSDEVSSLSAILLNDAYYEFLLDGLRTANGITVLDAEHLVPMKMKAWIDLNNRKNQGEHVNDKDLRKHRQDVFRLFPLIDINARVITPADVYNDIQTFIADIEQESYEPTDIGLDVSKDLIFANYKELYVIK